MLRTAIGPKVSLVGKFLPTGAPVVIISEEKSRGVQGREARTLKYLGWHPYLSDLRFPTAAATNRPLGGGFQPKRKWLSREGVPRPWRSRFKLYLFTLVEVRSGRIPETAPDPSEFSVPQAAAAWAADSPSFDVSYCCRKWRPYSGALQEEVFLSPRSTIRHRVPVSHFAVRAPLSLRTRQTSNLHLGIGLDVEKTLGRVSLPRPLYERAVESAAGNPGAQGSRQLGRSCRGAWRASTRCSEYKRSAGEARPGVGVGPQGVVAGGWAPGALGLHMLPPLLPVVRVRRPLEPVLCSAAAGWARGCRRGCAPGWAGVASLRCPNRGPGWGEWPGLPFHPFKSSAGEESARRTLPMNPTGISFW